VNARAEAPLLELGWAAMNQRWLVAEMARLHRHIEGRLQTGAAPKDDALAEAPTPWPGDAAAPSALQRIAQIFELSPFEHDLLLLAAGLELDRSLRALLPSGPSFSLALQWLASARVVPHWDALSPQAPLRRWQLLHTGAGLPAHAPLVIDERVLHAITGVEAIDERLRGLVLPATATEHADAHTAAQLAIVLALALDEGDAPPVLMLGAAAGDAPRSSIAGRDTAAAAVQAAHGTALLLAIDDLPADSRDSDDLARALDREAALRGAVVVLWGSTQQAVDNAPRRVAALLDRLCSAVIVAAPLDRARLRDTLARPIQLVPWAPVSHDVSDPALRAVLQQFRVEPLLLRDAMARAHTGPGPRAESLWSALREATRGGLDALAQRIDSRTTFDDLVLPSAQLEQLRAVAAQLAHRHTVYEDWGFGRQGARGLGIAALFAGESGTGKTMAAEAIANEARLDLYRIDLAATVSKYIGETEKNLARLFDAAEASGAVLLFDEADALFGKRSEVKDSHDRYANIEIAYLLQRIEAYRGLAVLTTNLKSALDKAFMRRIRFVVQFPFPDEAMREKLWRRQLPATAPQRPIDWPALARPALAGGHIRAAALAAAFTAAAGERPIDDELLWQAMRAEFAKLERPFTGARGGAAR
jgi:hypothetical protein